MANRAQAGVFETRKCYRREAFCPALRLQISIFDEVNPTDSDQKAWPLYCITPSNKPVFSANRCSQQEGKEKHSKDHLQAGVSQPESLLKEMNSSQLDLKQETC